MIPLSIAVKMAFKSVLWDRKNAIMPREVRDAVRNDPSLSFTELLKIKNFIQDNCPQFFLSDSEIKICFKSFQKKRPRKIKYEQLRIFE